MLLCTVAERESMVQHSLRCGPSELISVPLLDRVATEMSSGCAPAFYVYASGPAVPKIRGICMKSMHAQTQ